MATPATRQTPHPPAESAVGNHLALALIVAAWVFVVLSGFLVSILI